MVDHGHVMCALQYTFHRAGLEQGSGLLTQLGGLDGVETGYLSDAHAIENIRGQRPANNGACYLYQTMIDTPLRRSLSPHKAIGIYMGD